MFPHVELWKEREEQRGSSMCTYVCISGKEAGGSREILKGEDGISGTQGSEERREER